VDGPILPNPAAGGTLIPTKPFIRWMSDKMAVRSLHSLPAAEAAPSWIFASGC
jgi:hypothetical protein